MEGNDSLHDDRYDENLILQSGTGTNAISGVYQAGKTGTSNYADS